ncbi:MAG: alpha/beta hydrolase [Simkania sp.]|nr:alpha/beta hydrolase [Simkania sp.]
MSEKEVSIPIGEGKISGTFAGMQEGKGLVIFVHGSGSSRHSSRNRFVASELRKGGMATLLFDLLTPKEEGIDDVTAELRFNIPMLAERTALVVDWVENEMGHSLGLFGASTGAAAALAVAVLRKKSIKAVVSRGGRPDLALGFLPEVQAPTLLIVGGEDGPVIEMNREAFEKIGGEKELVIVEGATHLFEEEGKLEEVAQLSREWFKRFL